MQPSNSGRTAEVLQKSGASADGALSFLAAAAEAQKEFGVIKPQQPVTILTNLLSDKDLSPEIRVWCSGNCRKKIVSQKLR